MYHLQVYLVPIHQGEMKMYKEDLWWRKNTTFHFILMHWIILTYSSSSKTSTFLPVTTNSTSALFQSNQVDVPFARSLSPIAEDVSNDHQTFPTPKCSVSSLRCSEDDLKAFRADRFIMGAVPECPPPLELCWAIMCSIYNLYVIKLFKYCICVWDFIYKPILAG